MNALVILSLILLALMILIGGYRGMRSFISLFLNFGVLMFTIFLMLGPQMNPVIITLISCAIISCINLFFINNVERKTATAFLSTIVTIVFLIVLIEVIVNVSMIQGYGEEETEELAVFPFCRH